jgi:hypothetical protein
MMDEKIIGDLIEATMCLHRSGASDEYMRSELGYVLRLAWRTGVLDAIKDIRGQQEQQLSPTKASQS